MESHLGWMLEHSWDPYMDPLMVLMMASFRGYYIDTHWDILTVECMDLMKASNWYILMVKCLDMMKASNWAYVMVKC